jgi:hypothetical protein
MVSVLEGPHNIRKSWAEEWWVEPADSTVSAQAVKVPVSSSAAVERVRAARQLVSVIAWKGDVVAFVTADGREMPTAAFGYFGVLSRLYETLLVWCLVMAGGMRRPKPGERVPPRAVIILAAVCFSGWIFTGVSANVMRAIVIPLIVGGALLAYWSWHWTRGPSGRRRERRPGRLF